MMSPRTLRSSWLFNMDYRTILWLMIIWRLWNTSDSESNDTWCQWQARSSRKMFRSMSIMYFYYPCLYVHAHERPTIFRSTYTMSWGKYRMDFAKNYMKEALFMWQSSAGLSKVTLIPFDRIKYEFAQRHLFLGCPCLLIYRTWPMLQKMRNRQMADRRCSYDL